MTIKLYWWRSKKEAGHENFGDFLSPLIVEMVSGRKVVHARPEKADMFAIGSIMSKERKSRRLLFGRKLHIWGSGTDASARRFSSRHVYHAVRGTRTFNQINKQPPVPVAFGDPGLLVDRWWDNRRSVAKRFRFGIVPHFVDQADPRVSALATMPGVTIIDVLQPVESVVEAILACDFIFSSSMHGLIVADAFEIPNQRMVFSSGIISDLKFDDYYSAFGIAAPSAASPEGLLATPLPQHWLEKPYERPGLEKIKTDLVAAFPYDL